MLQPLPVEFARLDICSTRKPNALKSKFQTKPALTFASSYFVTTHKAKLNDSTAITAGSLVPDIKIQYLLNFSATPYGVSACNSGYTKATANLIDKNVCAINSYIVNPPSAYGTLFKTRCIRYSAVAPTNVGTTYLCQKCVEGYIPKADGSECVATIANCLTAQTTTSTLCQICMSGYLNVNGSCALPNIGHCVTYDNTATASSANTSMTCATCADGYYLVTGSAECKFGSIRNCKTYTEGSSILCESCEANHVLMVLQSVRYCYPMPTSLNCSTYGLAIASTNVGSGILECDTCTNTSTNVYTVASHSTSTTAANGMCVQFTPVAECMTYSESNTEIYQNTFACTECKSGYYYNADQKLCVSRTVTPAQCSTYTAAADTCSACNTGYYLVSGTACVAFPSGIYQCSIYSSATNCTQCITGYYLNNNACTTSTTIQNCVIYGGDNVCTTCAAGYMLTNPTTCTAATATNCLTVESLTACATCAAGRGLQTDNGVTSCVTISITNCVTTNTVSPFRCLVCKDQYYPATDGTCKSVANVIPDCIIYKSPTSCDKCAHGSVLSVDHLTCYQTKYDNYLDANCEKTILNDAPQCSQCSFGYVFSNGTCTACNNSTANVGCLNCNPLNNTSCILCRPGYYMNSSGVCIAVVQPTPTPTPTPGPDSGVNILMKAFVLLLSVLML